MECIYLEGLSLYSFGNEKGLKATAICSIAHTITRESLRGTFLSLKKTLKKTPRKNLLRITTTLALRLDPEAFA